MAARLTARKYVRAHRRWPYPRGIREPINAKDAQLIDVGGRTLMPGMIDAHVHAFASDVAVQKIEALGEAYRTAHAARMLGPR